MGEMLENNRLVKRAYWLIKLRWIATGSVGLGTFFAANLLDIHLLEPALYGLALFLALYNLALRILLGYFCRDHKTVSLGAIQRLISLQICVDLFILTALLHFSGGIENPFVFYFIFHMIIASILLSRWESFLQATYAVLLFGLMVLLEYVELLPHHCLVGFVDHCQGRDGVYILGTYSVFVSAMYLVVYMTSDISARLKKAERAYRLANIQLREKDHIKDEYVYRVTHDIKGHVATIQNCLDVVVDNFAGSLNGQQADFVNRARIRARNLMTFIRTLLKLTQLRMNKNLDMELLALSGIIDNALAVVELTAQAKSITVTRHGELPDARIVGNPISIEELLTNLLLNAVKYTPAEGTVELSLRENGSDVEIEIRDTGIGIPPEELPKVFDEFYRASNARKVERDGTGLGLSIARQIVQRHKGKITVDSKEGDGASFRITLPKAPGQPKQVLTLAANLARP